MRTRPPLNEPRRTNNGAAPSPLHLALSLIEVGERQHPERPPTTELSLLTLPNLYRSFAPIQIVHRGRAPMGLSLPCGKARKPLVGAGTDELGLR